jgi:acylphosphatase
MNQNIRMVIYVAGEVQGVDFRESVKNKIEKDGLNVTGYAENLPPPDGRVKIIFEGRWQEVLRLSEWVGYWPGVVKIEAERSSFKGEFNDFQIK